ncbi:hypothetical protein F0562_034818 [Nyssa sinensis]|uniref:SANT domain-containing protein n=1 Tax=Nyssa sinensis TaxID=561372 RepID=A0A5J5AD99_9ASTE|nr:hypothetical protein F0562_034818 [Nyssa sinensis]
MEMDSVQPNHNGDCINDTSGEQLLSPDCFDAYDVFGEPRVLPRVGDQYQVDIPPLIMESDYLLYMKNPFDAESMAGVPHELLMGLPIPVMWISKEVDNMKHDGVEFLGNSNGESYKNEPLESETVKEALVNLNEENLKLKVEPLDTALDCGMGVGLGESPNIDLEQEMKIGMHQKYRSPGNCLVPGSFGDSWSGIEEERFLLGLYIFEKNLVLVKKFIESKKMRDLLSFYYGKFYRSAGYQRWSDCRKMRSKRCVYGPKIFTGLRQQEFLSRLLPRVSEECQITLLEVSKTYGEGKISLEEYVFTLKAIVGMDSLVNAVGIGRGKQDLTGIAVEPSKSNHVIPMRPEIPIGKACSTLTPGEIIKFLTGDFRLSKARSNDLFWEAVWPRLLARGWHSEQPKNQVYAAGSKHSLVFLMPGVKKFVRRRLVKGNHYFDCISDVLNKVASDPGLLELDIEGDEGNRSKEEYGWKSEAKLEQDDLCSRQRHFYLQPRTPNPNTDLLKFTVVDTSLADRKTFKVRELRTLLVDVSKKISSRIHSKGSDRNTTEVSTDESDSAETMLFDQRETANFKPTRRITDMGMFSDGKDLEMNVSNQGIPIKGSDSTNAPSRYSKDHNNLHEEKKPRKAVKCKLSQRLKHESLNCLAPVTKRRCRLTACSHAETNYGMINFSEGLRLKKEKRGCCSDTRDSSENSLSQMGSSPKRLSSTSSSKGSPIESSGGIFCATTFGAEHPYEKPQPRTLIDLNLPHVPPDFETGEAFMMELRGVQDDQTKKQQDNSTALETSIGVASSEQQPNMNSRRQSTRNRPPTARVLEALAGGFLTINRRRKIKETGPQENSTSRPPRRARYEVGITENFDTGNVASKVAKGGNDVCNDANDMFRKFQVLSEGNGAQVSGP